MNHPNNFRKPALAISCLLGLLLFLSACQQAAPKTESEATTTATTSTPSVVFIYADSILAKYNVFQEKGKVLAQREQEENVKLQQKAKSLEQEVRAIQNKVQQGLLAPNQIAREEQRMGQKQQEIMMEREKITQELMAESQKLNLELQEKLTVILKELQAERGYDFILSYGQGTAVLMVNDALDISDDVLARLNASENVN